jgi:hypothetical protein
MHESTCNNRTQLCAGRGPGWPDHFASTLEIARRQTVAAQRLYDEAQVPLRGPVQVSCLSCAAVRNRWAEEEGEVR